MEKIKIVKKISKIVFYISASFALIFGVINWYILSWSEMQQNGSIQSVECNLALQQYRIEQELTLEDSFIAEMKGRCDGVSTTSKIYVAKSIEIIEEVVE